MDLSSLTEKMFYIDIRYTRGTSTRSNLTPLTLEFWNKLFSFTCTIFDILSEPILIHSQIKIWPAAHQFYPTFLLLTSAMPNSLLPDQLLLEKIQLLVSCKINFIMCLLFHLFQPDTLFTLYLLYQMPILHWQTFGPRNAPTVQKP